MGLPVHEQVHAGVVDERSLMDVDIESVIGLHLERGLHSAGAEEGLRAVAYHLLLEILADFGETAFAVLVFLGVVVARNPPAEMVAGHRELGELLLDHEIGQRLARGELVAESESVVEEPETDVHELVASGLAQFHEKLVVVVAYLGFLSPDGLPYFIERVRLGARELEALGEGITGADIGLGDFVAFESDFLGFHRAAQLEAQQAREHDICPFVSQGIFRHASLFEPEAEFKVSVGRFQGCGGLSAAEDLQPCRQGCESEKYLFHRYSMIKLDFAGTMQFSWSKVSPVTTLRPSPVRRPVNSA